MATEIRFVEPNVALEDFEVLAVVGRSERLGAPEVVGLLPAAAQLLWPSMLQQLRPGDEGSATSTWIAGEGDSPARRIVVAALPEGCGRHNSPARPHGVADAVKGTLTNGKKVSVLLVLDEAEHAYASGVAIARVLPEYSEKSKPNGTATSEASPPPADEESRPVWVAFLAPENGAAIDGDKLRRRVDGVRLAARLVDTAPNKLDTEALVSEARRVAEATGASLEIIAGADLASRGFGGLWNVGRTASSPPALVVLSHVPSNATRTVAMVGKGIVYDTGGLSIKARGTMAGMKCDMGGAAAVLGAFQAAVNAGTGDAVHALLCLAENSVGTGAMRPDDVIALYSGKTVEVNNTDAEGRLVIGDGVAYATKHLAPTLVIDVATLTGAQLVATGKRHAAIVTNDEALEQEAVAAGKRSGDLVHPLPYAPEFFRAEFKSKVADMKNSVKDRMNAQASCAAQFVAEHLVDYSGPWLHVDIAGPAWVEERGTGFGVALLCELLGV